MKGKLVKILLLSISTSFLLSLIVSKKTFNVFFTFDVLFSDDDNNNFTICFQKNSAKCNKYFIKSFNSYKRFYLLLDKNENELNFSLPKGSFSIRDLSIKAVGGKTIYKFQTNDFSISQDAEYYKIFNNFISIKNTDYMAWNILDIDYSSAFQYIKKYQGHIFIKYFFTFIPILLSIFTVFIISQNHSKPQN